MNLKRSVGTTKDTKDTKKKELAPLRSFTQWENNPTGPSVSAFVCFVCFVVGTAGFRMKFVFMGFCARVEVSFLKTGSEPPGRARSVGEEAIGLLVADEL